MTRPAMVRLVPGNLYDTERLKFVCFVDPDGWEYEGESLCPWDWFDTNGRYIVCEPSDCEPVFESTSVFRREDA